MNDSVHPYRFFISWIQLGTGILFLLLSLWVLRADGNPEGVFFSQSPLALPLLGFFLLAWFMTATLFAIFPKKVVILSSVFYLFRLSMGWPLNIGMDQSSANVVFSALVALCALYYVAKLTRYSDPPGPLLSKRHSLTLLVAGGLLLMVSLPLLGVGMMQAITNVSGGYVHLSWRGLELTERVFEKEGQRVSLTGMIHVGDASFYQEIEDRLQQSTRGKRLVLTEGVSDRHQLLPRHLASRPLYINLAQKLGLTVQTQLGAPASLVTGDAPHRFPPTQKAEATFINADIDLSELSTTHQTLLVEVLSSLQAESWTELWEGPLMTVDRGQLMDLMVNGLIKQRNDRLMAVFQKEGRSYPDIHIPWGAAHLPDLESRLQDQGYQQVGERSRPAIRFWKK